MISYEDGRQSPDLLKLQQVQKALALCFFDYCRTKGYQAFLVCGSALGACRGADMIPWDDDIDVGMLREDYERFMREYVQDPLPGLFLQNWRTEKGYPYAFAKLRLEGTALSEPAFDGTGFRQGIFLDIFPFDDLPRSRVLARLQRLALGAINVLVMSYNQKVTGVSRTALRRTIRRLALLVRPVVPLGALIRLREWLSYGYRRGKARTAGDVISFEMYGVLSAGRTRVAREVLLPPSKVRFGDHDMPAPGQADVYLTSLFGDWRTPPPEAKRVPFHSTDVRFGTIDFSRLAADPRAVLKAADRSPEPATVR